MKKVKLCIAGLLLSGMSYGQTNDSITMSRYEVIEMINDLEDILEWQQEDINEGNTSHGSFEEGWGSNYWLTEMRDELRCKLNGTVYIQPFER